MQKKNNNVFIPSKMTIQPHEQNLLNKKQKWPQRQKPLSSTNLLHRKNKVITTSHSNRLWSNKYFFISTREAEEVSTVHDIASSK